MRFNQLDTMLGEIMLNTKEHYDLIHEFEKAFKTFRLDKEDKSMWEKSIIYQDGTVNSLFLAYRSGYMLGRCVYMNT